jgi:hypothetical protein
MFYDLTVPGDYTVRIQCFGIGASHRSAADSPGDGRLFEAHTRMQITFPVWNQGVRAADQHTAWPKKEDLSMALEGMTVPPGRPFLLNVSLNDAGLWFSNAASCRVLLTFTAHESTSNLPFLTFDVRDHTGAPAELTEYGRTLGDGQHHVCAICEGPVEPGSMLFGKERHFAIPNLWQICDLTEPGPYDAYVTYHDAATKANEADAGTTETRWTARLRITNTDVSAMWPDENFQGRARLWQLNPEHRSDVEGSAAQTSDEDPHEMDPTDRSSIAGITAEFVTVIAAISVAMVALAVSRQRARRRSQCC